MAALKTLLLCGLAVTAAGLLYGYRAGNGTGDLPSQLPPEEVRFGEYDLVLKAVEGSCDITYRSDEGTGTLKLRISEPCRFIRPDDKVLKVYRDEEAEVFAVIGGQPEYDPLDPIRTTRADCGTQVAAVIFSDGAFRVADPVLGPVLYCAFMGMDQKDYWLFLHG